VPDPALRDKLQTILEKLIREKKIGRKGKYYFLKGRENIVKKRIKREKYSKKKMEIAKEIAKKLGRIPFVKMIGVTGALSMNNSDEDDDIDFFIITAKNRLWMTRFLCVIILEMMGKRRRPKDKEIKDKICLNMFLDEEAMSLGNRNLYTAHEAVQMRPVFDRGGCYEKFLSSNRWVLEYLPNSIEIKKLEIKKLREEKKKNILNILISQYLNILECMLYCLQKMYMSSKITREKIGKHFAFFHPVNRKKEILEKFRVC
jgi:hypothetical protein